MEFQVNQSVKIPFVAIGLGTGRTSFSPIFLNNGQPTTISPSPTFSEIGSGVYTVNFVPASTGNWSIFIEGSIQKEFQVVSRTLYSLVQDLTDEALGSWTWDKTSGVLTVLRGDSSVLATYKVLDSVQNASRERLT